MSKLALGKRAAKATLLLLLSGLGSACSHTVSVQAFEPSSVRYPAGAPAMKATLADERPSTPEFSHGDQTIYVEFANESTDELAFLGEALRAELSARGIRAEVGKKQAPGALTLRIRQFEIRNHASAFGPLVAFASFAADVSDGQKTVRVVGYAKNLKRPVWVMSEVDRPCYTNSLRALVGEVASKINRDFVGASSSDAEVSRLAQAATDPDNAQTVQATYELGYTNNPRAITTLTQLTKSNLEPQRAAALSGLGLLGAVEQLEMLKDVYINGKTTSDRYTALKAIGDLGTPEALAYLEGARQSSDDKAATDIEEIVALYLSGRSL
jgi:hypothetical protein